VFTFSLIGTQGAIYQMLNHGISTGGLFILVGILYERRHTFDLSEYGGIATVMPIYAGFFIWIVMSSVGLPLLNGFVGEFMIMVGTFTAAVAHAHIYAMIAAVGVIVGAMYLLHWTRLTIWGELSNPKNKMLRDLDGRELAVLASITLLTLFMGIASPYFLNKTEASTARTLAALSTPTAPRQIVLRGAPLPNCQLPAASCRPPLASPVRGESQ
ncbi:MAG: proton-conducting transporter membrane subunit, partial [Terriglobales bacterium]